MKKSFLPSLLIVAVLAVLSLASCNQEKAYDVAVPAEYLSTFPSDSACGDVECRSPVTRGDEIWCPSSDDCKKLGTGCDCFLWGLDKESHEWKRFGNGKHPYDPDKYIYRCYC